MTKSDFANFAISEDRDGKHAVGHGLVITADKGARVMHRRCVRMPLGQAPEDFSQRDSILFVELDGVYVYVKPPGNIIVTKRDLKL